MADDRRTQAEIDRLDHERRVLEERDVVIDVIRLLLLRSPKGKFWSLTVSDVGTLSVTDLGGNAL